MLRCGNGTYLRHCAGLAFRRSASLIVCAACSPASLEQRDRSSRRTRPTWCGRPIYSRVSRQPVSDSGAPARFVQAAFRSFGRRRPRRRARRAADASEARSRGRGRRRRLHAQFRKHAGRQCRQSRARRHSGRRLCHRPARAGPISLSSGRPIAKKDVLFVLESALRANNLAMMRDGARLSHRSLPTAAPGVGRSWRNGVEPGYGMTVIPLQYVSGATLSQIARRLRHAARRHAHRSARTDAAGRRHGTGAPIRAGDGAQFRRRLDARPIGRHVSRPQQRPEPVVAELEKIMDSGEAGLGHGLVKFQAVPPERDPRRRRQAGIAARRGELDRAARFAQFRERGREGLQGALRRRQADRATAQRHVRARRRLGNRGYGDQPDRAVVGAGAPDHDRAPHGRAAQTTIPTPMAACGGVGTERPPPSAAADRRAQQRLRGRRRGRRRRGDPAGRQDHRRHRDQFDPCLRATRRTTASSSARSTRSTGRRCKSRSTSRSPRSR